jgi:gas vesicle protein
MMAGNERNSYESVQDQSNNHINTKDFLIGTLVGGIVGALTALFLAPKSGKELREDLNDQAYLLREKTESLRETAIEKSSEITSTVKDKTSALSKKVSEQSQGLVNKVKGIKADVEDEQSEGENAIDQLFETDVNSDIQQKLEETKKAFDETESKINQ